MIFRFPDEPHSTYLLDFNERVSLFTPESQMFSSRTYTGLEMNAFPIIVTLQQTLRGSLAPLTCMQTSVHLGRLKCFQTSKVAPH